MAVFMGNREVHSLELLCNVGFTSEYPTVLVTEMSSKW